MENVLKNRVDRFYPESPAAQIPNSPQAILEQKQREEAKNKVLKALEKKKTAAQIAKLKAEAIAKARVERARSGEQSAAAQEAERKAHLLEAIEMQAAEEEAPQRAIIETAAKAAAISTSKPVLASPSKTPVITAAKELLAMQGTTRADVQRLLTNLNINMNLQLTKTDTANLLACLLTCNEQQLYALEQNPKVPIAIKIVIKRLKEDVKQGNMNALERIWDRVFGKAAMSLDLPEQATATGIIPNTPISREAYVVIRETLLK